MNEQVVIAAIEKLKRDNYQDDWHRMFVAYANDASLVGLPQIEHLLKDAGISWLWRGIVAIAILNRVDINRDGVVSEKELEAILDATS